MEQPRKEPVPIDEYFAMEETGDRKNVINIKSIDLELSLDAIYDRVKLSP